MDDPAETPEPPADNAAAQTDDGQVDGGAQTDDGTPQPAVVNTGSPIGAGRNVALLAVALGGALLAVGALAVRRRVA